MQLTSVLSVRTRRRLDRERKSQSRTPSIASQASSINSNDIQSIQEAVEPPAQDSQIIIDAAPVEVVVSNALQLINHTAANVPVDEEANDDSSTGRRSQNSNETHRPGTESH